jgi:hypothetical protein
MEYPLGDFIYTMNTHRPLLLVDFLGIKVKGN